MPRRRFQLQLIGVLQVVSALALAGPNLPDKMVLKVGPRGLRIVQGKISAPVDIGQPVTTLGKMTVDAQSGSVTLRHRCEGCCYVETETTTLRINALRARLANRRALDQHRQKRYAAAAEAFARAVRLDPSFDLARSNLACALAHLGKRREAVAALQPLLARKPFETYYRVLTDPDLGGLVDQPEIAALRSKAAMSAQLKSEWLAAYSAKHQLVAVTVPYQSWGTAHRALWLHVLSLDSGKRVAKLPLVLSRDMNEEGVISANGRAAGRERLAHANGFLKDLGFEVPPGSDERKLESHGGKLESRFPRAHLALVVSAQGTARLIRRNRVLGKVQIPTIVAGVAYHLPAARAVVFSWAIDEPEGCGMAADAITGAALVRYLHR